MNMNQMMKQFQTAQKKMTDMQEDFAKKEFSGSSGGGMVHITLNGKSEVIKVKIDPLAIKPEDVEILEDLIVAGYNDARKKLDSASESETSNMFSGMLPPGFKMPF